MVMTDLELAVAMLKTPYKTDVIMQGGKNYDFKIKADIDAGLTYIGQMIVHDIVAPRKSSSTDRLITGELNLDSLYGPLLNSQPDNAPGDVALFDRNGRFKLGRKDKLDLYRINGVAQIPEPRNDENIIIAQLHNLWLRLHNFLLDAGYAKSAIHARELVCLTFQLIVVEDFLDSILKEDVFNHYFRNDSVDMLPDHNGIPRYFSHASFRFGHSIVRRNYRINDSNSSILLSELFRRDKGLTDKFLIDWRRLFSWGGEQPFTEEAMAIDTLITSLMGEIPTPSDPAVHIALANITAGREADLPNGLDMAKQYQSVFVKPLESTKGATFEGLDINKVPLWPYILLEAQVEKIGKKLGGLGSVLNAQVLRTSMSLAQFSIFKFNNSASDSTVKDFYRYDLRSVLFAMGQWGEALDSAISKQAGKLSMYNIINLINHKEE